MPTSDIKKSPLYVDSTNNRVGVGTASPSTTLDVTGPATVSQAGQTTTATIRNTNASWANDVNFVYSPSGTDTSQVAISNRSDGSSWISNGYGSLIMRTGTGGTPVERMRVTDNGVTFNGDTAAANALDDYEEGTWTPTFSFTDAQGGHTFAASVGRYVKVGNTVTINAYVRFSALNTAAGSARMSNLPYTPINTSELAQVGNAAFSGMANSSFNGANGGQCAILNPNDATIRFFTMNGSGGLLQLNRNHLANSSSIRVSITYFV